jgi:hypothetical protein
MSFDSVSLHKIDVVKDNQHRPSATRVSSVPPQDLQPSFALPPLSFPEALQLELNTVIKVDDSREAVVRIYRNVETQNLMEVAIEPISNLVKQNAHGEKPRKLMPATTLASRVVRGSPACLAETYLQQGDGSRYPREVWRLILEKDDFIVTLAGIFMLESELLALAEDL